MNNATPTANLYNCIISGNSSEIEYGGTVQALESQVSKQTSIIGTALLGADGSPSGGWSFDAGSMLGALGFHNGGATQSFPLIDTETNPAADQGMSQEELISVADGVEEVESQYASQDQNGKSRSRKSIGSYAL